MAPDRKETDRYCPKLQILRRTGVNDNLLEELEELCPPLSSDSVSEKTPRAAALNTILGSGLRV